METTPTRILFKIQRLEILMVFFLGLCFILSGIIYNLSLALESLELKADLPTKLSQSCSNVLRVILDKEPMKYWDDTDFWTAFQEWRELGKMETRLSSRE